MGDVGIFKKLGSYESKISLFYCLDKDQKLDFKGDFAQDNQNLLIFEFERCHVDTLRTSTGYNANSTCFDHDQAKEVLSNMGAYMIYTS